MKRILAFLMALMLALSFSVIYAEDTTVTDEPTAAEESAMSESATLPDTFTVPVDALKAIEEADTFPIKISNKEIDYNDSTPKITYDITNENDFNIDATCIMIAYDENASVLPLSNAEYIDSKEDYIHSKGYYTIAANSTVNGFCYLPDGVDPAGVRIIGYWYRVTGQNNVMHTNSSAVDWRLEILNAAYNPVDLRSGKSINDEALAIENENSSGLSVTGAWGSTENNSIWFRIENHTGRTVHDPILKILGFDAEGNPVDLNDASKTGSAKGLISTCRTSSFWNGCDIDDNASALVMYTFNNVASVDGLHVICIKSENDEAAVSWESAFENAAKRALD